MDAHPKVSNASSPPLHRKVRAPAMVQVPRVVVVGYVGGNAAKWSAKPVLQPAPPQVEVVVDHRAVVATLATHRQPPHRHPIRPAMNNHQTVMMIVSKPRPSAHLSHPKAFSSCLPRATALSASKKKAGLSYPMTLLFTRM